MGPRLSFIVALNCSRETVIMSSGTERRGVSVHAFFGSVSAAYSHRSETASPLPSSHNHAAKNLLDTSDAQTEDRFNTGMLRNME